MPDYCTITIDIRTVPGMTQTSVFRDLKRLLALEKSKDPDFRYEIEPTTTTFPYTFQSRKNSKVAKSVIKGHKAVLGRKPNVSTEVVSAVSDASWMVKAGIDGVIYGPSGKYLSRPDERYKVQDIFDAA